MRVPLHPKLSLFTELWNRQLRLARERAFFSSLLAAAVVFSHLARLGTSSARIGAGSAIAFVGLLVLAHSIWRMRSASSPRRLLNSTVGQFDRDLAERCARAVALEDRSAHEDPLTRDLSRLHLARLLGSVRPETLVQHASAFARRWNRLTFATALIGFLCIGLSPFRVVEGLDVLLAQGGIAPVSLDWADEAICEVHVPRYLHEDDRNILGFQQSRQPRGSLLAVHIAPLHDGRVFVLRDGKGEVPFADDGHGRLVARYTLDDSVRLEIAARFGSVVIPQLAAFEIESIADDPPLVNVDGAPTTIQLIDRFDVPITYSVQDDHGLTQVELVLRSGDREDRRVLARLDGQRTSDKGSAIVRGNDRFLQSVYGSVELTVEARDNDPITGPKWGKSKIVTLIPPSVGEAEARRYEALVRVKKAGIALLAWRMSHRPGADTRAHQLEELSEHQKLLLVENAVVSERYGSLRVSPRLSMFIAGQLGRLEKKARVECAKSTKSACLRSHEETQTVTEDLVLSLDMGLRSLANKDATTIAKRLSGVAKDAADGLRRAQAGESEPGLAKFKASSTVLFGGAGSLARLDGLGRDLSEVVHIGLRRITRSLADNDYLHAILAAQDLSLRLANPLPSFSGGGGRSGATMGSGVGEPEEGGDAQSFDGHQSELERIAGEHAEEMGSLEQDLQKFEGQDAVDALRSAAKEHARAIREAVKDLPRDFADPGFPEGAAASARGNAQMMADALERVDLPEALNLGSSALKSVETAKRLARDERNLFGGASELIAQAERARETLEREQKWTQQQVDKLRRARAERAKDRIDQAARAEEQMANRSGDLSRASRESSAPMPDSAQNSLENAERSMREAARAFRGLDYEKGLSQQREAQRQLEMARDDRGDEQQSHSRQESSDANAPGQGAVDIPRAEDFKGPRDFRKRVMDGLGMPSDPRLREAVRRYAEGLLR